MPLFFIISGMLWNVDKYKEMPFGSFIKKKFKAYMYPYFKVSIICLVVYGILIECVLKGNGYNRLLCYVGGIIYSRGTTEWMPQCSPLWFLTCIFCAELFLYFCMKSKHPIIWIILCALLGYVFSIANLKMPWNFDTALTVLPFFYIGIYIRKYWNYTTKKHVIKIVGVLAALLFVANIYTGNIIDFDGNKFSNFPVMYLASTSGVLLLFILFSKYKGEYHSIVVNIGKDSLFLMGYNYLFNVLGRYIGFEGMSLFIFSVTIGIILIYIFKFIPQIKKIII